MMFMLVYCISSLVCARPETNVVLVIEMHFAANNNGKRDIDNHVLNDCLLLACRLRRRLMCLSAVHQAGAAY